MARPQPQEQEGAGGDSFLDVITNIVGILIILVMIVGQRGKDKPIAPIPSSSSAELAAAQSKAVSIEQDVHRIATQMASVQNELAGRANERNNLSTLIAAIEKDLADRRQALDAKSRGRYDYDRDLALVRDELNKLDTERMAAEKSAAPETVKIESYPTPIGKVVEGKEVHFQLVRGRIAYIPYDPLVDRLRSEMRANVARLQDQYEFTDTIGPIEGFRLRYSIERHDAPQGSFFQVSYVEFLPVSGQLGEPMDEALQPNSRFRHTLDMMPANQYTVTVWTYPDSFAEFRRLKKDLYEMGYAVAGRPLPEGMPIGASPHGSKSSAQ